MAPSLQWPVVPKRQTTEPLLLAEAGAADDGPGLRSLLGRRPFPFRDPGVEEREPREEWREPFPLPDPRDLRGRAGSALVLVGARGPPSTSALALELETYPGTTA